MVSGDNTAKNTELGIKSFHDNEDVQNAPGFALCLVRNGY
jgi:hypothetical protein